MQSGQPRQGNNVFDLGPGGDSVTAADSGYGNTFMFDKGDGQAVVNMNGGSGTVVMAADIAASDVILQADGNGDLIVKLRDAADSITLQGDLVQHWWGVSSQVGQIAFADGSVMAVAQTGYNQGQQATFTWIGSANNPALIGSNLGNNVFELGAGSETASGSSGANTYVFKASSGQATINPSGSANELNFAGGITDNQLWFQQSGNDLKIDLMGTTNDVTVAGWFGSPATQVQSITAQGLKVDNQVAQLVQAMATYSANNAGFDPTTAAQAPNDLALQSTIAAAWHQ